jgi:hypothetical protein
MLLTLLSPKITVNGTGTISIFVSILGNGQVGEQKSGAFNYLPQQIYMNSVKETKTYNSLFAET